MESMLNYMVPEELEQYLSFYGRHFNKKLCDFAVENMMREDKATGGMKKIVPMKLEDLKSLLEKNKIQIENNEMYDALYLANMVKSDFLGSSIEDDTHLAKYVADVLCDADGYEGMVFTRYLADTSGKGEVIFWNLML